MSAYNLFGLAILLLIILGAIYGLHRITRPVDYTKEEYERRLKKGSGIAGGALNALMYPLQELLSPKAVEAVHVKKDMKAGYYDVRQENGDTLDEGMALPRQREKQNSEPGGGRTRPRFLQRLLMALGLRR